jgi:hypothetical protein
MLEKRVFGDASSWGIDTICRQVYRYIVSCTQAVADGCFAAISKNFFIK